MGKVVNESLGVTALSVNYISFPSKFFFFFLAMKPKKALK